MQVKTQPPKSVPALRLAYALLDEMTPEEAVSFTQATLKYLRNAKRLQEYKYRQAQKAGDYKLRTY